MTARLSTLLIWAAVAASAVYWGLRLFTRPTPVPAGAVVAAAALPAIGSLNRLLGTPPAQPVQLEAAAPVADSRFRLVGVVAPRGGAGGGLALISVDGQPPRAWAVGRELEPGLRLLAVNHRQAELGAARGAPAITLALPPLAEAQRGRPGAAGLPGAFPGGVPAFNRPGGLAVPRLPGAMPGMPGMPVNPQEATVQGDSPEPANVTQPEGGQAPTR